MKELAEYLLFKAVAPKVTLPVIVAVAFPFTAAAAALLNKKFRCFTLYEYRQYCRVDLC